ncbi:translation elongation factor 2 [Gloeopeniophorella convolvens]|nr:translation elongation factor 2 [Gloeopeniophorella convolvens]
MRNMAICAHIDSGKTTLTESILLKSSFISTPGTVDTGSTTTDFLPAERERGITIQSASIPVKWKDWMFNLIDTPGHADFGMEVESASRVVDGAVVLIDSVEGVEAQTKGVWQQLDRYGVPSRILVLNKLDRPGASFHSSLLSTLAHRIHPKPVTLALPVASFEVQDYSRGEPGIQGIVDLVKWELWRWSPDGSSSRHALPTNVEEIGESGLLPPSHPLISHLVPARTALLESLAMFSNDFMEHLLELPAHPSAYLTVATPQVMPTLRSATLNSDILPVLCGSAVGHIGTEMIMDYVGELLASPLDVSDKMHISVPSVRLLAWKVSWDKKRGWMTFVRVYSGKLTQQSVLINSTRGVKERASKLLLLYASEAEEVEELPFGSVGVVLGLKHTRTGDTLVSTQGRSKDSSPFLGITPPPTVMSASVIPQSHADLEPVEEALNSLMRTDPSVRVETNEGQLLVHGLGALHLEIVEGRLKDEWKAKCEFGPRRVAYRESIGLQETTPSSTDWAANVGGRNVTASVTFSLRPLLDDEAGDVTWDDNLVLRDDGQPLPSPEAFHDDQDPWAHLSRGIASTLSSSPHTSLPLSRTCIEVATFHAPPDAPPSILSGASAFILRKYIKKRGRGPLMEPFIRIRVSVGSDVLGKVMKDIVEHGGEIFDLAESSSSDENPSTSFSQEGVYVPPKWLSPSTMSSPSEDGQAIRVKRPVHAVAPLSQMLDYSTRLRALSGGHGQFDMVAAGFRIVHAVREAEILREIGRA